MLFCCNLFNWPQKRRLEHVQPLPAPACLPARLTDALSSLHLVSLAVTSENGTVGRREEGRQEAARLDSARMSPPPLILRALYQALSSVNLRILVISQASWVQILPVPLLSCVTLGKIQNLSVPWFPHL